MRGILDRGRVRRHLEAFDLQPLFIDELGWDYGGENLRVEIGGRVYDLVAIAHKRGMVAYQYAANSFENLPDHPTRQKIDKAVTKAVREHLVIYANAERTAQYWQWVKREPGRPDRSRQHIYHRGQPGEALIQRLEHLAFTLEEEEDLSIVDVSGRVRAAFDVERVTKRFYDRFKTEHGAFLAFIQGIENIADREWYASLMLNRMMFIYFIQKRGFLDGDPDYLRNRLERVRREHGGGKFLSFYRLFLLRLFHQGLGQPEAERTPEMVALLGRVPYLNGGLFDVHDLERDYADIQILDEAFERVFDFFDAYQWHLDDRPLHRDNEINPDVLGYIFEKYVNQKQMGAYYTKEDITGYIGRNTIIPFLFDQARKECPIAFKADGGVWRLLRDDPDRYIYDAVRHGITYDVNAKRGLDEKQELPADIAAGLDDVSKRGAWNKPAPAEYALPTETWREHVARREGYEEVCAILAAGGVASINDLITYNLDIETFALDAVALSEGPELVRAFWKALNEVSILDPTCGSGAFLFAALNLLEPLYVACLEAMRGLLDDLERSGRKHHPETMSDFRKVLERLAAHAKERYFILKSIIVGNLYGVDIMEEAVEICKLRLFLKLVAQLDSYDQIEPLPDIDFNIRAGNTLVGFTSFDEIKRALGDDLLKRELVLPEIEEGAEVADRAFRKFREMQTEHGMDAHGFNCAKTELRERLKDLRAELDRYLAGEYGITTDNPSVFENWQVSHQPFHWFVEFYGIVRDGGFDIIIGNPPYVEYSKVRQHYTIQNFETQECGDLYAYVLEESCNLLADRGRVGMIIPVSISSADGFNSLREHLNKFGHSQYYQGFAERPSKLFTGVEKRLAILLLGNRPKEPSKFVSNYRRWNSEERKFLFDTVRYTNAKHLSDMVGTSVAKVHTSVELNILKKIGNRRQLENDLLRRSDHIIYYTRKVRYFVQFFDFVPYIFDSKRNRLSPSELKELHVRTELLRDVVVAILNSGLFYWFFCAYSDVRNLNRREIAKFPCSLDQIGSSVAGELQRLSRMLMEDFRQNSIMVTNEYRKYGIRTIQTFQPRKSKSLIDEIDSALATFYGLSDVELDFIINYQIKYRLGQNEAVEEEAV